MAAKARIRRSSFMVEWHTLGDLLALVDFAQFLLEHLVALLTDLNDLGSLDTPS